MVKTQDHDRLQRWVHFTDTPLTIIAIGSLPILFLHFISNRLSENDLLFLFVVDLIVFMCFFLDYVVRLLLTQHKSNYVRSQWLNGLVTLAQFLALLPALGVVGVLRAVRGFRVVLTLARIIGLSASASKRDRARMIRENASGFAFGLAGFTWITSAVAFTIAEDVGSGSRYESFFDALWWSATTITTVGYGDVYPVTAVGRIVGVMTMVIGVSVLALVTARIAKFLIQED